MAKHRISVLLFFMITFLSCDSNNSQKAINGDIKQAAPFINFSVINSYPHDTSHYTEGFVFHKGKLYESTGAPDELPHTKSIVYEIDTASWQSIKRVEIDRKEYFGEGIVFLNKKLFFLTYLTNVGFIYDDSTFKKVGKFSFPNKEGWGLTTDGQFLIMSDGTNILTYYDPNSINEVKKLDVLYNKEPLQKLNELEFINGFIYANVYTKNIIVKIDPKNGEVISVIDLNSLANEIKYLYPGSMEMNGIAFNPGKSTILITGKMWPKMYELNIGL